MSTLVYTQAVPTIPPANLLQLQASTYGSGSINATFASDILRLQDLWTGIMWSLLSPLFRVLITIIYAFTVSPQAQAERRDTFFFVRILQTLA